MEELTTVQEIVQRLDKLTLGEQRTGIRFYVRVVRGISKRYTPSGTDRICSRFIPA